MALIVQKYGGTSVGSIERIRNVARRVARYHREGHQLVVVVSAMAGETNRLLALARELLLGIEERERVEGVAAGQHAAERQQKERQRHAANTAHRSSPQP